MFGVQFIGIQGVGKVNKKKKKEKREGSGGWESMSLISRLKEEHGLVVEHVWNIGMASHIYK